MAMQYINYVKSKTHTFASSKTREPVLSEEDEKFLSRIISQENPPALPPRSGAALAEEAALVKAPPPTQIAPLSNSEDVPPSETPQLFEEPVETDSTPKKKHKYTWSWLRRDSRDLKGNGADRLAEVADDVKDATAKPDDEEDVVAATAVKEEEEDMASVLEKLNLAAVDNRVFSISDETQKLLHDFNQVLKDLINGVPTAYDDLETLLVNGDRQLQKTYSSLPSFLQKLVEKLPDAITKGIAPEIMAAAADRASKSGVVAAENAGKTASASKAAASAAKKGLKSLSLKELTGTPAAIATLLRSILTYLRARFPAFMGVSVLWSLALFVLLMVFWYCHKRGREVRLAKESESTEEEVARLEKEYRDAHANEDTAHDG
ncbi:hypothetical protein DV735_g1396, partial [Chaetothyriales sp. CBS 134920]